MVQMSLREDADRIICQSIEKVLPDKAVADALRTKQFESGEVYVAAVGKAAWQMARSAADILGNRIKTGIVITKYGHVKGEIPNIKCFEAGHPVSDRNSFSATQEILDMVRGLWKEDTVLFLLSGGGSALFEKPLVAKEELQSLTGRLLACGADIVEINTVRKRLSMVKGGRFAKLCEPAKVYSIVLSDILGDPLDMIASGPACPDLSTSMQALEIVQKYNLKLSDKAMKCLQEETPKMLDNVETVITGSVGNLCRAAADACVSLGYSPIILTDQLNCEAKEAGAFLAAIAKSHQESEDSLAFIAGGETVVHLTGTGKGGRNQEIALAAAEGIASLRDTAVFSVGSDGTDGPTDAAGGYSDGRTKELLKKEGIDIYQVLQNNDAYTALKKSGGLIITGPTGTNVNDISVVLIRRDKNRHRDL